MCPIRGGFLTQSLLSPRLRGCVKMMERKSLGDKANPSKHYSQGVCSSGSSIRSYTEDTNIVHDIRMTFTDVSLRTMGGVIIHS